MARESLILILSIAQENNIPRFFNLKNAIATLLRVIGFNSANVHLFFNLLESIHVCYVWKTGLMLAAFSR